MFDFIKSSGIRGRLGCCAYHHIYRRDEVAIALEKRKVPFRCRDTNHEPSSPKPSCYTDSEAEKKLWSGKRSSWMICKHCVACRLVAVVGGVYQVCQRL